MKITVRCYLIPADVTFDTKDIKQEIHGDDSTIIIFDGLEMIWVDRGDYLKRKNHQ